LEEAQTGVATTVRRRRGTHGVDEAVVLELEEVSIVWQGAGGDTMMRWWRQGGEL
jgi:hypothetical protein